MANETMLRACHLLNQCDSCSRKVKYRNSMKIEEQIGACKGCRFYEDMKQLRPLIDSGIEKKYKRILEKGEDMTTREIIFLIDEGVKKEEVRSALNMPSAMFADLMFHLGLSKRRAMTG